MSPSVENEPEVLHSLLLRAKDGDSEAFSELFERFYPMIHAFCYRSCLCPAQAQDLAQETFIKAARSIKQCRGGEHWQAWLYRIAVNAVRDWLRQKKRRERLDEALRDVAVESDNPAHERVADALAALPRELRITVALVYEDGMSHAAAARALGCAETTVSWRLYRARRKLKTLLSKMI